MTRVGVYQQPPSALAGGHALLVVPVACSSSLTAVGFDEAIDLSVAALDVRAHFLVRLGS